MAEAKPKLEFYVRQLERLKTAKVNAKIREIVGHETFTEMKAAKKDSQQRRCYDHLFKCIEREYPSYVDLFSTR